MLAIVSVALAMGACPYSRPGSQLDESQPVILPCASMTALSRRPEFISQRNIKCTSFCTAAVPPGPPGTGMLYQAYQAHSDIMVPVRALAGMAAHAVGHTARRLGRGTSPLRNLTAAYELIARAGLTHARPPFGIDSVTVGNREVAVTRGGGRMSRRSARCCISRRTSTPAQPRVLLVAPLSGHFATLLRGTVRTMLPEHDVYITDWHNARDVATAARPLRLRRICRPPDPVPGGDRAGRACRRGVPALRRGAGGGRGDGAGRQSGAAAQHDADGRADRHPRQPDQGQRARQRQADRLVREEPDRARAVPLRRRAGARSIRASCSSPPS